MSAASTLPAAGRLTANEDQTARLSSPAEGRIVAVHVRIGETVGAGRALVTLQSSEAASARADYTKAQAEVSSRRASAVYARTAAERAERLIVAKAMSRQEFERAQADNELARSMLTQAEAELRRAATTMSQLGVSGGAGGMILRAPISGIIVSREAIPGTVVTTGAPLITVTDPSTLWLDISAPDRIASSFRAGANLKFTVPAYPGETFQARVQTVGGALDPQTRSVLVRAVVDNSRRQLKPEMFASVEIESGIVREGVAVPDAALQLLDQKPVVFIAVPNSRGGATFERRNVTTGAKLNGRTQIISGLNSGDLVVMSGAFAVKAEFARSRMAAG